GHSDRVRRAVVSLGSVDLVASRVIPGAVPGGQLDRVVVFFLRTVPSHSSKPRSTAGSCTTTPAGATTATSCAVAHHAPSSTPTQRPKQRDHQPHGPSVTSGPEALGR